MKTKINKLSILTIATMLMSLCVSPATYAWGPVDRPTYTNHDPAEHAVFNSITDNAAVGDERDFVRVSEKREGVEFTDHLTIEPGKQYEVWIYYHNDASATYNDKAHNYVGVARDVRVSSIFPLELDKGEQGMITGKIMASNTDPKEVWDEAYITAEQALILHYIEGSAKIYNKYGVNGQVLSKNLFSNTGIFIGLNELNGVILGCDEYSGQIVYTLQAVAVDESDPTPDPTPDPDPDPTPDPDPDPTPDPDPEDPPVKPEIPKELPTTGPLEIVLAVAVVIIVVAGVIYWNKTNKAVKKATRKAKGKK